MMPEIVSLFSCNLHRRSNRLPLLLTPSRCDTIRVSFTITSILLTFCNSRSLRTFSFPSSVANHFLNMTTFWNKLLRILWTSFCQIVRITLFIYGWSIPIIHLFKSVIRLEMLAISRVMSNSTWWLNFFKDLSSSFYMRKRCRSLYFLCIILLKMFIIYDRGVGNLPIFPLWQFKIR